MSSTSSSERESHEMDRSSVRPVPAVVDWLVGALLIIVGLAFALGGAALFTVIDRSEIREALVDAETDPDPLTLQELVDVSATTGTWSSVGLIVLGVLAVLVGLGYVFRRGRARRRARAGEAVSSYGANALLGAIVAVVLSFVPFSQVLGGIVAGYLERATSTRDVSAGALSGFLTVVPLLFVSIFVLVGGVIGLLDIGEPGFALAASAALLLSLAILATLSAALGAIGGWLGGKLRGTGTRREVREPGTTT